MPPARNANIWFVKVNQQSRHNPLLTHLSCTVPCIITPWTFPHFVVLHPGTETKWIEILTFWNLIFENTKYFAWDTKNELNKQAKKKTKRVGCKSILEAYILSFFVLNNLSVVLAVRLESPSCRKVNLRPSLKSPTFWNRFFFSLALLYIWLNSSLAFLLICFPVHAD